MKYPTTVGRILSQTSMWNSFFSPINVKLCHEWNEDQRRRRTRNGGMIPGPCSWEMACFFHRKKDTFSGSGESWVIPREIPAAWQTKHDLKLRHVWNSLRKITLTWASFDIASFRARKTGLSERKPTKESDFEEQKSQEVFEWRWFKFREGLLWLWNVTFLGNGILTEDLTWAQRKSQGDQSIDQQPLTGAVNGEDGDPQTAWRRNQHLNSKLLVDKANYTLTRYWTW